MEFALYVHLNPHTIYPDLYYFIIIILSFQMVRLEDCYSCHASARDERGDEYHDT